MFPHERSLVKRLSGKPFVLLGVNSDEDRGRAKELAGKNELSWPSWWDGGAEGPIQAAYNITQWPTVFVVDAKGVIRSIDVRGDELDEAVDKLLEEVEKEKAGQEK